MHDNQQFHWLYGIEEKAIQENKETELLRHLIEVILRGNVGSLDAILASDRLAAMQKTNMANFNSVSKTLMSYWLDAASNDDLLSCLDSIFPDPFITRVRDWNNRNLIPANVFNDHFSRGQMQSKLWLLDILELAVSNKRLGNVVLYGGWYGTVNLMLHERFNVKHTYNLEIDTMSRQLSTSFNEGLPFTAVNADVTALAWEDNKLGGIISANTIINTSSEHMNDDWFHNIPDGKLVVLQTNDYFDCNQHVNCVLNLEAAQEKYQFSNLLYSGELQTQLYNRFMLIGVK